MSRVYVKVIFISSYRFYGSLYGRILVNLHFSVLQGQLALSDSSLKSTSSYKLNINYIDYIVDLICLNMLLIL